MRRHKLSVIVQTDYHNFMKMKVTIFNTAANECVINK